MTEGENDDDDISVTSTVASEQLSEYEVETILTEVPQDDGSMGYLVKWANYPIERATMEPADSFDDEQTLLDWEKKKRQIAEGKLTPFDYVSFDSHLVRIDEERDERKRKRAAKRSRLGLQDSGERQAQTAGSSPITGSETGSNARIPGPSKRQTSHAGRQSTMADPRQPPASNGRVRTAAEKPLIARFGTSDNAPRVSQYRARQTSNPESSRMFNRLSTRRRFQKAKAYEPAPDINALELFAPSKWLSNQNLGHRPVKSPRIGSGTIAQDADNGHPSSPQDYGQAASPKVASATTAANSANRQPGSPRIHRTPGSISLINNSPQSASGSSMPVPRSSGVETSSKNNAPAAPPQFMNSPDGTIRDTPGDTRSSGRVEFPRREAQDGCFRMGKRFLYSGELLVYLLYGPDKREIGHVRLCGLTRPVREDMLARKPNNRFDLWFSHSYTVDEYSELCDKNPTGNFKHCNGWIEGFNDTEPKVDEMGTGLDKKNAVAICYPDDQSQDVLLAYSPRCRAFDFLDREADIRPQEATFLHIAVRSPLRSREGPRHPGDEPADDGLGISGSFLPPNYDDAPVMNDPLPPGPAPTATNRSPQGKLQTKRTEPAGITTMSGTMPDLTALFKNNFSITFSDIATVRGSEKGRLEQVFYLLFPLDDQSAQDEYQLLLEFLKYGGRDPVIYSNHVADDWEKFIRTSPRGVVLFHHSFVAYHTLRFLKEGIRKHVNFWNVSLSRPLPLADRPLHFQRLFPHGGVILLSEDFMLHNLQSAVVIIAWFVKYAPKKYRNWKLMLRPNAMKWLLHQIDNEPDKERLSYWLTMYRLIMQVGGVDPSANPDPDGIHNIVNEYEYAHIISPPHLRNYGYRRENDHSDIPKGLNQEQRNTDHLFEMFAGWALINSHKFRYFVALTTIARIRRWEAWNHLEVTNHVKEFMKTYQVDYRRAWDQVRSMMKQSSMVNPDATITTPQTPMSDGSPMDIASRPTDPRVAKPHSSDSRPADPRPSAPHPDTRASDPRLSAASNAASKHQHPQ